MDSCKPQQPPAMPSQQTIGSAGQSVQCPVSTSSRHGGQPTHLEVLCNFTNETLERQLANEQLGRLLVSTNFTKSDRSWTESMRLLYTTGRLQT
ncbi:hypothetical protein L210DRAFT_2661538 [Boletus edulis BED1]|uniref:Uncharacterized protein n=1 Tax=Boletus edulis BED1 TaxID=1328754 RepID=A0AAD4GLJ7_BOLED|nr:hypothetical protein L210DRAFT_2661538 [Boletus edulis BED1]